jgi:hypothetical protein
MGSTITINGKTFRGNSIQISKGSVIIDGEFQETDEKIINITVEGNIENLETDYTNQIKITGDVGRVKSSSGDVDIVGNVNGPINSSSGDIEIDGNVIGDVETSSGDVKCKDVTGSVKTKSGDIKKR